MLEELTKEYNLACAKAVQDAIHELAEKWDNKVVDELNESDYKASVVQFNASMCIYARVAKDDYYGPIRYEDDGLNAGVQEALDTLDVRVVLNAMLAMKIENINQVTRWRIK